VIKNHDIINIMIKSKIEILIKHQDIDQNLKLRLKIKILINNQNFLQGKLLFPTRLKFNVRYFKTVQSIDT